MDMTTWLSLVAVCVMGAISPGPSLAVILRVSISQSSWHGVVAAVTHALGLGFWAVLSMQGLAVLIAKNQDAFFILSVLGGLYLAWLGTKTIRYAGMNSDQKIEGVTSSYWESARDAFLVALMNPKAALFFLALFSQFVHEGMSVFVQFQLWATVVVIDGGWYILVALVLAGGPVLTWLRRHSVWVDRVMGTLLILLGLNVVVSAFL